RLPLAFLEGFLPALVNVGEKFAVTIGRLLHARGRFAGERLRDERIDRFGGRLQFLHDVFGSGRKLLFWQRGESKPWRKNRMMFFAPFLQPRTPPLHRRGIKLPFAGESFGLRFVL